jgi:hypothetical protein
MSARRPYRGPAGAIDPSDPAPLDAAYVRSDTYYELLAHIDHHLSESIEALSRLTPSEADLRHFGEVLVAGRNGIIRPRRARATQLTFPFHTQTSPDV